jgi:hypothetical protein
MRMIAAAVLAAATAACAFPQPYEADPVSSSQWQRRQDQIEYREKERQRLCAMMNKDSDRFKRDCTRPGDPS